MNSVERLVAQARSALAQGQLDQAHALALDAARQAPSSVAAVLALGDVAWAKDVALVAAQLFQRAHTLSPQDPAILARLSAALAGLNQLAEAREAVARGLALKPRDGFSLETFGVTLTRTGDYHQAVPLFERAATLTPQSPGLLFNLAFARQYVGDLDGAERAYRRVIAFDPDHAGAYQALAEIRRQTPKQNLAAPMRTLFTRLDEQDSRRLSLGHALAKTAEDLDDYPAALEWLTLAKAPRRARIPYDPALDMALIEAARASAPGSVAATAPDEAPIFVMGMPRSGTTLTDRILSSHAEVRSVGEFQAIPVLVKQLGLGQGDRLPDATALASCAASSETIERLGSDYLEAARGLAPDRPRQVDKLPFNFLYAGLIHRALPSARIVCLRREAMDVCLSNYRQLFGQESDFHSYAYDLADIARYYVAYDRLIAHWRAVLPADRFLELRYEDLVADQEGQTRRLLAFCGLDWDPACLDFQNNAAGVSTASSAQVRQPMFTSSIGRWKRYGLGVAEAEAILAEAGLL